MNQRSGPLVGLKVIELGAIGPVPFAAGYFGDLGADVLRIESPNPGLDLPSRDTSPHLRSRACATLNLRNADDLAVCAELINKADVLLEGFRPGTLERLGLDPRDLCQRNPGLIVGRMTGWGQTGPMADRAGHDINYIAMSGPLAHAARAGQAPVPPINLLGDFGGGAMFLITGVLSALYERSQSGQGQVIDAAMVDGAAYLMMLIYSFRSEGMWRTESGTNLLDTGAPFYDVYETADHKYLAVGCLEPKFYAAFIAGLGLDPAKLPPQHDVTRWPELRALFAATIAGKTRDEWDDIFGETDACATGIRDLVEAATSEHLAQRETFLGSDSAQTDDIPLQPAPAPRFSRTPGQARPRRDFRQGEHALQAWGIDRSSGSETA
ncbi:MAG: CoA transferase [Actinomycetia bacterium]|nr:CoA transferase [Actinomycetes bacterium]